MLDGTGPASAGKGAEATSLEQGLAELLGRAKLQHREEEVQAWCKQQGAAILDEVLENLEDLAGDLGLTEQEVNNLRAAAAPADTSGLLQQEVDTGAPTSTDAPRPTVPASTMVRGQTVIVQTNVAPKPHITPGLAKLSSTPITGPEQQVASTRAAKAYIPLRAWVVPAPRPAAAQQPPGETNGTRAENATGVDDGDTVSDDGETGEFRTQRQDKLARQKEVLQYEYRGPGRITHGWELRQLKHRIPSPQEMSSVADAEKALQEKQREMGPTRAAPATFDQLQDQFLEQYSEAIKSEMPGVELTKAKVAPKVQNRFMNTVQQLSCPTQQLMPTYHGTASSNFPGILEKGLLVPKHDGVTVANGSMHGVGVYTAEMGAAWLSKGFVRDDDKMFVCAVADPKDDKLARPTAGETGGSVQPRWTGAGGQRFHRITQKATEASSKREGKLETRESKQVKYARNAVVVFDERCVTPLLVASNINDQAAATMQSSAAAFVSNSVAHRPLPGKAIPIATHAVRVGDQQLWVPPEEDRWKQGMKVRRVWNAKEHDKQRQFERASKASAQESHEDAQIKSHMPSSGEQVL